MDDIIKICGQHYELRPNLLYFTIISYDNICYIIFFTLRLDRMGDHDSNHAEKILEKKYAKIYNLIKNGSIKVLNRSEIRWGIRCRKETINNNLLQLIKMYCNIRKKNIKIILFVQYWKGNINMNL